MEQLDNNFMDSSFQANNPFMASVVSILLQATEDNRIQEASIIAINCTQEVSIVVATSMAAFFDEKLYFLL